MIIFSELSIMILIIGSLILQVFIPGFPKEVLLLQAGATFGVYLGAVVNWIGMVLAAQVGYEVVRKSVETGGKYSNILDEYQNHPLLVKLKEKGNLGLFFIRLIPYAPNDVASLLSGGLLLPRRGFLIVSFVTAIPYAIVLAYLGSVGDDIIDQETYFKFNLILFILGVSYFIVRMIRTAKISDNESVD